MANGEARNLMKERAISGSLVLVLIPALKLTLNRPGFRGGCLV
jgi:hypothetical protein